MLRTIEQVLAYALNLITLRKVKRSFDFYREFLVKAGERNTVSIPLADMGVFAQEGYNIVYSTQADGTAPIKLKFRSKNEGSDQSNDYLPIELIATPGVTSKARYGIRNFFWPYRKDEVVVIDWDGTALTEDCTVGVLFAGTIYTGT